MTPQELAGRFDLCVARAAEWPWRDPEARAFADWLAGFWQAVCPVPPPGPPDAISALGWRADGVRWFAVCGAVAGYVAGDAPGCYRVPRDAAPPTA
jgi:hypothetical protein